MRVAVLILGLVFTVVVFLAGFWSLTMRVLIPEAVATTSAGLAGGEALFLVALLFLVGSAFALGKPRFASLVFFIASLISIFHSIDGLVLGYPAWALVALVLAVLSFLGRSETRRQHPAGNPAH